MNATVIGMEGTETVFEDSKNIHRVIKLSKTSDNKCTHKFQDELDINSKHLGITMQEALEILIGSWKQVL